MFMFFGNVTGNASTSHCVETAYLSPNVGFSQLW